MTIYRTLVLAKFNVFVALLLTCHFISAAEDRVALLFGINDYPESGLFSDLSNPISDVRLIADNLRKLGFHVISEHDADGTTMKMKLGEFQDMIKPGGTAMFYFAGHGIQFDGKNYLMGKNAKLLRKYELGEESMSAQMVLEAIKDKQPKSSFIFLDCCRNPPPKSWLTTDTRSFGTRGLTGMGAAPGMAISFSAAPGEPAADGDGEHSPFALSLARHIMSGKELGPMLKAVANDVYSTTNQVQRPWHHSDFLHDFYFSRQTSQPTQVVAGADVIQTPSLASGLVAANTLAASTTPIDPPKPITERSFAPILPMALPGRGYFDNDEVFLGSAYSNYNSYSKKKILKKAQGLLNGAGSPDGRMGKNTQSALITFQATNQLPVTGRLDQATLARFDMLGEVDEAAPSSSGSSRSRSSGSPSTRSNYSSSKRKSSGSINVNKAIDNGVKLRYIIGR